MTAAGSDGPAAPDDVAWFEGLFTSLYDEVLRYAARRVGADDAGDVAAEVFTIAWRRRGDYPRAEARLWVFGVARGVAANATRSRVRASRLVTVLARQPGRDVADPAETITARLAVLEVLAGLPDEYAEALRLIEWDGFTPGEAAVISGCTRGAFRVRLHRARRMAATGLQATPRSAATAPPQPAVHSFPTSTDQAKDAYRHEG